VKADADSLLMPPPPPQQQQPPLNHAVKPWLGLAPGFIFI
jgi:hypothetical protein